MSAWTIQEEICKLAQIENFRAALHHLKIIQSLDADFDLREDKQWKRGGAETYVYRFWIRHKDGTELGYILKACVTFSFQLKLEEVLDEWIARRDLLSREGIRTPKLISYGNGVILEELVSYRLKDILVEPSKPQNKILTELSFFAGVLSRLGFSPIDAFSDLRSHGDDVVVIDFGEDIGPPAITLKLPSEIYEMMLSKLEQWGIELNKKKKSELLATFMSSSMKEVGKN